MNKVRCAIYTRKSSEEGLEQDFNSLHAQREACSAYVLSQASEGWSLLPDEYDDGGISGGTLERPALQRLIADIEAGKIDIVVVYKVDRLTRSLLDFSKLVEAFDKAGASFVSVTQSFNTTTSMGRLTLNMLLSFTQFEREVTAERIRDKIAASKAKGMWMGGVTPLGYRPDGRTLAIVDEHADVVRDIFRRYLEVGNVRELAENLEATGVLVPSRTARSGLSLGGGTFKRGQLYAMLSNPVYVGEIHHKGCTYSGQHQAIIGRDLWNAVQQTLASHRHGAQRAGSSPTTSLLAGLVSGEAGEPLIATHASKGKLRYRYYVSKGLHMRTSQAGIRMPAAELEKLVCEELARLFDQPLTLVERAALQLETGRFDRIRDECGKLAKLARQRSPQMLRQLISKIEIVLDRVEVLVSAAALASALAAHLSEGAPPHLLLKLRVKLRRSGNLVRLIDVDRVASMTPEPQAHLVRLLSLGRSWWSEMLAEGLSASELAARHQVDKSYVSRVVRLNFLSPNVTASLVEGRHPVATNAKELLALRDIPLKWAEQEKELLA